jgi:uncharacterized cupin superfamily protein
MSEAKGRLLRASEIREKSRTGSHPWNEKSEIHGLMLARVTGLKRTGVSLARVAPGKESFLYHLHHYEEEWIYILSGRGVAEIDGAEHEVGPGDFMGFPTPSVAHHMRNPFGEDLVYLMGGENLDHEVADLPRLGKRMARRQTGTEVYDLASGKPYDPLSG